jgi:UDP-N-acetylglucosamine--N-acetylmuramyl-(pentapeptide) pyrophosphoryl-undecaprenol N-acetylglucosamine transferase
MSRKKVLIAAGGTGGHMFPAQALARELASCGHQVLFAGAKLDSNKFFHRDLFAFTAVSSATISKKSLAAFFSSMSALIKGCKDSWKIIDDFRPDVVVGFGSFHSVPLLVASIGKKIPIVLFESNAWPGRVNRLFSRFAKMTAVQFSQTMNILKGKSCLVEVPFWQKQENVSCSISEARAYYGIHPDRLTLLVFGGSQGAKKINEAIANVLASNDHVLSSLQLIHLIGKDEPLQMYQEYYENIGVKACVKTFEDQMQYAWTAADLAVCRAGAATVAEMIRFEIPALLVPFAKAAEDHQKINAQELERLGAAIYIDEIQIEGSIFKNALSKLVQEKQVMKEALKIFKNSDSKYRLIQVVENMGHLQAITKECL